MFIRHVTESYHVTSLAQSVSAVREVNSSEGGHIRNY